ncbi:MAG: pantetheine-phosphate adenylyltransferase [Bacteroidales bacterium]|nr:pantetheine-phosphate adenylyltransferase [Bacteroidales bacterium]
MKNALFPGSFDPFTIGHESVVRRALSLFDNIIIAVGHNTVKGSYFSLEQRVEWIKDIFKNEKNVEVEIYDGLTVDFCIKRDARYILRGLRTSSDFEYERAIAQMNRTMHPEIETVFILTMPEHTHVTSTIVRDVIRHGGDASKFLPEKIKVQINNRK